MTNRRTFIKELSALSALSLVPNTLFSKSGSILQDEKIWGLFLHLSYTMWDEYVSPSVAITRERGYRLYLRVRDKLWYDALERMAEEGMNVVVITLGDAVKDESPPEIAVRGAWSVKRLREELEKIRKLGIEPIPELN